MLISRSCPICQNSSEDASVFIKENIDPNRISSFSFASRKEPEFMSHQFLRCKTCDLLYVGHAPAQSDLTLAYHMAEYDSSEEAGDAALTYIEAIAPLLKKIDRKARVLEIGSGNGAFLDHMQKEGFSELFGVEPSTAAIAAASVPRRGQLKEGIFDEADFAPASFDLICCFMTLEHTLDPMTTVQAVYRLLKPGGAFVTVTHDYRSLVNKAMGAKSPIFDIEHMQLFSKKSITELFNRCEFDNVLVDSFTNRYTLKYWMRLMPLPKDIKDALKKVLNWTGMQKIKVGVNVGNIICSGFK